MPQILDPNAQPAPTPEPDPLEKELGGQVPAVAEKPLDLEKELGGVEPPLPKEAVTPVPDTTPKETVVDPNSGVASEQGDDLEAEYAAHRKELDSASTTDTLERELGGAEVGEAPAEPGKNGGGVTVGAVAKDVSRGMMESAGVARHGVWQGLNASFGELGRWMAGKVPDALGGGIVSDAKEGAGIVENLRQAKLVGKKEYDEWKAKNGATKDIPEFGHAPTTMTGSLVQGVAQFLTGFAMGGVALKGVKAAGGAAQIAKGMAQGAIGDFAAFDAHEERLSNLIEKFPALQNPITEYLAANPKDSQMEGRFKNVIEGLGLGGLTEGMLKAVKTIRQAREASATMGHLERLAGEEAKPREVQPTDFHPLGDPEQGLIGKTETKLAEGMDATKDRKTSDISGKAKSTPEYYINYSKIETSDDIKTVIKKMAQMDNKAITEGARGKRSWDVTSSAADNEDAWKLLMDRSKGETFNAEESVAVRRLWTATGEKLKETARLAKDTPTEVNLFNFRKMMGVHYAVQKEVLSARAESARALNAWKMPVGSGSEMAAQVTHLLEMSGGEAVARDMATNIAKFADAGSDIALTKFVEQSAWAKTRGAVAQVFINNLLTNPQTHVANFLSNIGTAVGQIFERKGAEIISQKLGTQGGVELGEAMAMTHGMLESFKDSLIAVTKKVREDGLAKSAKDVFTGAGESAAQARWQGPAAVEAKSFSGALASETWNIASDTTMGRALDLVDNATRAPGRLMGLSDEFFKSIGYRMELHARSVRQAAQEFGAAGREVAPDAFKKRVQEIIDNPPSDIHLDSVNQALYQTFQNKPAESFKKIGDAIQVFPILGRLLLPFKNTPINIMSYSLERSPLAPLTQRYAADIAAGGARADIATSRMATGTMIMAVAMDYAVSGQLTGKGGSANIEEGQAKQRAGIAPYSMKVGDKWVSYNRLDPIGFTIGMAADIAEAAINAQDDMTPEDYQKVLAAAVFSVSNNVLSKTYMRGISEFFNAVTNPKMAAQGYMQRIAGSAVPAGVASLARNGVPTVFEGDPYLRSAGDMVEAMQRRIPGISDTLPAYRDLWGRRVDFRSGEGWAYDVFSPVYIRKESQEPVDKELLRLNYYPKMPLREVFHQGVKVPLDQKQYARLVQLAGNKLEHPAWGMGAKDFLNAVISGDMQKSQGMAQMYEMLSDGPDGGKAQFIQKTIRDYKQRAEKQLIEEDAKLSVALDEKKANKKTRLKPELMGR